MNPAQNSQAPGPQAPSAGFPRFCVVALILVTLAGSAVVGVVGFFRLGSETAALRDGLIGSVGGDWDTRITLHAGGLTAGLVRVGSRLFAVPPEARAAIDSVRGAEVGVYESRDRPQAVDHREILQRTDKAMSAQGWERIIGVAKAGELVAVYFPQGRVAPGRVKCCLMVLEGRQLVVAGVRGDPRPLVNFAAAKRAAGWPDAAFRQLPGRPQPKSDLF